MASGLLGIRCATVPEEVEDEDVKMSRHSQVYGPPRFLTSGDSKMIQ